MNQIDFSSIIFNGFFLLWAIEIFWVSILNLKRKKGIYFLHEKVFVFILRLLFGKKYIVKVNEYNLGGKKWKSRGIIGLVGSTVCIFSLITYLLALFGW